MGVWEGEDMVIRYLGKGGTTVLEDGWGMGDVFVDTFEFGCASR